VLGDRFYEAGEPVTEAGGEMEVNRFGRRRTGGFVERRVSVWEVEVELPEPCCSEFDSKLNQKTDIYIYIYIYIGSLNGRDFLFFIFYFLMIRVTKDQDPLQLFVLI
jgi:hypothetical protein